MKPQHRHTTRALLIWLCLLFSLQDAFSANTATVEIGGERYELEIAATPRDRAQGLMHRKSIDERGGMIFTFPDFRPRSFWMKNCLVDMDIAFLDDAGIVVQIHSMRAEPLKSADESVAAYHQRLARYPSNAAARFAIELRAGTLTRLGVASGAKIDFDLDNLRKMAR